MIGNAPHANIEGEGVLLGPFEREQIPLYNRWFNNFETLRTQGEPIPKPMSLEVTTAWYDSYVLGSSETAWFTVYERAIREPIGWTELKDIDYRNRSAEFAVMIGDPSARGKGNGTETARLMLDYGFTALGLHSIHLYYYEFNPAAQRAYERTGFREYARRRESHLMGGKLWDTVYMECLATEFESPLLGRIFAPDMPRNPESE